MRKLVVILVSVLLAFLAVIFLVYFFVPDHFKGEYRSIFLNPRKILVVFVGVVIGISAFFFIKRD